MNVTIVIATCGDETWKSMGDLAYQSIEGNIIRVHEPDMTVSQVRNYALRFVNTKYVCFVDADDTLAKGYFDFEPVEDVTVTSIRYKFSGEPMIPKVWLHEAYGKKQHKYACKGDCLPDGNYIHVGAIVRTELVKEKGGFDEYPVFEDWALWLKLYKNGATFGRHPESVYEASVRENNNHRNRSIPRLERNKVHEKIYEDIMGKKWQR